VGYVAIDMPGTGESPLKIAPGAERMLSRLLDAVTAAPAVDKSRVAIYGGSFGGYWSTILAATERDRVKAVVAQSPPIHETFSADALERAMSNKEYLFDYIPAYMSVYADVGSLDDLRAARAKASLQAQGIIGRKMAPMLVIGGVHDTQVPIADIDLLLHSGETPKEAWINPAGGHMGPRIPGLDRPGDLQAHHHAVAAARARSEGGVGRPRPNPLPPGERLQLAPPLRPRRTSVIQAERIYNAVALRRRLRQARSDVYL